LSALVFAGRTRRVFLPDISHSYLDYFHPQHGEVDVGIAKNLRWNF